MKVNTLVIVLSSVVLMLLHVDAHPMSSELHRSKRGVDLATLRRLMNNIAMSEFYRLRGLEVLGTIGGSSGKPGGIPDLADDDGGSTSTKSKTIFDFPIRNKEFQQFFGSLGVRRNGLRG